MPFLEEFFYGNIDPQSRGYLHPKEMLRVQETIDTLEEQLTGTLSETDRALLRQHTDAWSELNARSDLDSFVTGFRMGAQMTLDTFVTKERSR